jgi:hypothetical protein
VHGAPLEGTIPPVLATLDTDTSLAGDDTVTGLVTMPSKTEQAGSSLGERSARITAAYAPRTASWMARLNALACVGASCCPGTNVKDRNFRHSALPSAIRLPGPRDA